MILLGFGDERLPRQQTVAIADGDDNHAIREILRLDHLSSPHQYPHNRRQVSRSKGKVVGGRPIELVDQTHGLLVPSTRLFNERGDRKAGYKDLWFFDATT